MLLVKAKAQEDNLLPARLPVSAKSTVRGTTVFGGLTPAGSASADEICACSCLSPNAYPALHTRVPRQLYLMPPGSGRPHGVTVHRGRLIVCQGTGLYLSEGPGTVRRIGSVSDTDKTFASLGRELLVLPDKLIWSEDTDTLTSFSLVSPAAEDASVNNTYIQSGGVNFELLGFRAGDCVYLEVLNNWQASLLNGYYKIKSVYGEYVSFCTRFPVSGSFSIRLSRVMPDLEGACAVGDRIYGFKDNRVYVCEAGNPRNWYAVDDESPEDTPVSFDTGSDTPFTACIAWQGYPVLFKQDHICRILGRGTGYAGDTVRSSSLSLADLPAPGVGKGMAATLCEVGGALYYGTDSGVYRYTGTYPVRIDRDIWAGMNGVCSGTDGRAYWLILTDGAAVKSTVYRPDLGRGSWLEEDGIQAVFMTHTPLIVTGHGIVCVMQRQDGSLWAFRSYGDAVSLGSGVSDARIWTNETAVAEFGDDTGFLPGSGRLKAVTLKAAGSVGAALTVRYSPDGGAWETLDTLVGTGADKLYRIPVHSAPAAWYRLRLEMTGEWSVSGLWRETEAFSHG